jgi:hypothetical protein
LPAKAQMHMYVCDYRGSCVCESLGTRADSRIVLFASLMTELEANQWPSGQQHRPGKKGARMREMAETHTVSQSMRSQCGPAHPPGGPHSFLQATRTVCSRLVVCLQKNEQNMIPCENGECDRRGSACARPCSRPCAAGQSCLHQDGGFQGGQDNIFLG